MSTKWPSFHNPDVSLTVLRRRVSEELLEALEYLLRVGVTGGRALLWHDWFRSDPAYLTALSRLRKAGLIVTKLGRGGEVLLDLVNPSTSQRPWVRPESHWNRTWNGIWYVLVYDVPEKQRAYRDTLRHFLERQRMGCLQKSVWVTPRDIRPEYDDLCHAADVQRHSFLLESHTVLGRSEQDIVTRAWDFDRITTAQAWFCETCRKTLERLNSETLSSGILSTVTREEMAAYSAVMVEDPLLPSSLCPAGYIGKQTYRLHLEFMKTVSRVT